METAPTPDGVLIVGAGPTGLTLATLLARYGVPVRVVERRPRLSRHTKATNLMQRSQEVMAALGLIDPLNRTGGQMRRLMVHAYGKCFGPRTMRLTESPHTDVLLCGQHNFEAVVAAGLAEAGVPVEFGTELVGLAQDAAGVTATLSAGGRPEAARFAYAVGCDGHAGVTRTFTRHDFTTHKTGVAIRQVDCRLAWRRLPTMDQMWLFYFDKGFAVVVPLPGGVHRILTIEPKAAIPEREPTLDEMQAKLRVVADDASIELSDPQWFSYTDLSMGIAPGLVDGRVILAGDVGNPVLPNGGQGMNTGIGDAFNLGWKLAAVLRHGGPAGLLATYDAERHALRTALQKVQYNSLKYTTLVTPWPMRAAFRLLAEPLLNRGGEYAMAKAFSELAINTRKSAITTEMAGKKGVRAGDRALDAACVLRGEPAGIHKLVYGGGWTVLAFTGVGTKAAAAERFVQSLEAAIRGRAAEPYVVSAASGVRSALPVLFDLDEEVHRVYRTARPLVYVVRPDGYVGGRFRGGDWADLSAYLDRWLPKTALAFAPPVPADLRAAA